MPTGGPQHRGSGSRLPGGRFPTVAVAVGAAAAVLVGMGAWAVASHGGDSCGSSSVSLTVAAAPDIEPTLAAIIAANPQHCLTANLTARSGSDVAHQIQSAPGTGPVPDVWIPDTSQWIADARSTPAGRGAVPPSGASLAMSPVVIAMPTPVATSLTGGGFDLSWRGMVANQQSNAPLQFELPDPTTSGPGLSALAALSSVTGTSTSPQLVALTALLHGMTAVQQPSTEAILNVLPTSGATAPSSGGISAFPATEQAVFGYDNHAPAVTLTAVYPSDGSIPMDYPYVEATGLSDAQQQAANGLFSALTNTAGRTALAAAGFRAPDGSAGPALMRAPGLSTAMPPTTPVPQPDQTANLLNLWSTTNSALRVLYVVDLSGSMGAPLNGDTSGTGTDTTRLALTAGTMQQGLSLLPDASQVGLWSFTTDPNTGATIRNSLVPLGPLTAPLSAGTRRQATVAALTGLTAQPGKRTGLYDTVVAGYQEVEAGYDPTRLNSLVVFTDGLNPELNNISLDQAITQLHAAQDPAKPVQVVLVAVGPGAQMGPLQQLAAAIGQGSIAVNPTTPDQIRSVFYQSLVKRLAPTPGGPDLGDVASAPPPSAAAPSSGAPAAGASVPASAG